MQLIIQVKKNFVGKKGIDPHDRHLQVSNLSTWTELGTHCFKCDTQHLTPMLESVALFTSPENPIQLQDQSPSLLALSSLSLELFFPNIPTQFKRSAVLQNKVESNDCVAPFSILSRHQVINDQLQFLIFGFFDQIFLTRLIITDHLETGTSRKNKIGQISLNQLIRSGQQPDFPKLGFVMLG